MILRPSSCRVLQLYIAILTVSVATSQFAADMTAAAPAAITAATIVGATLAAWIIFSQALQYWMRCLCGTSSADGLGSNGVFFGVWTSTGAQNTAATLRGLPVQANRINESDACVVLFQPAEMRPKCRHFQDFQQS